MPFNGCWTQEQTTARVGKANEGGEDLLLKNYYPL